MLRAEWRFLQLTMFIGAWMLLAPMLQDRWLVQLLLQLFLLNTLLVTLWANPGWPGLRTLMIGLWLVSLTGSILAILPLSPDWRHIMRSIELVSSMPLLALLAAGILRFVFRRRQLTADGIFATVAVYLIVALLFAQLYLLLLEWNPASFNLDANARTPPQLQSDLAYFSLITLATVGYGDILPVTEIARTLAAFEATVGQFYVAVVVAVFVGMYAAQRRDP
ncbi:MAG: ion channel [Gammaproteobacteria bacterium]|nr:ion channel [Gammaproteobacteria bacterium]